MNTHVHTAVRRMALIVGLSLLAACGPKKPAPTPPPPQVPVVIVVPQQPAPVPMRPLPPRGSAIDIVLPTMGPDGIRNTVNARLNGLESVWNLRSGWNVAALNCLDARYQPILDGYKAMLISHAKRLTRVNGDLDKQYRANFGGGTPAIRAREAYMTQVYNYFALPPARDYFCEASLQISQEALLTPPQDIDAFAATALPRMEAAFERFYQEMERYRIDVAAWDAKYAPAPAYVPLGTGTVYTNATYGASTLPAQPVVQNAPPPGN